MKRLFLTLVLSLLCITLTACRPSNSPGGEPANPQPQTTIENKGSDTIVNLALAWAEAYQSVDPSVSISITGGGSGTGIAALINNTAQLANASRAIKEEERQAALANGIDPYEIVIDRDAIAIIVNHANPVEQLTLQQLSDIYAGKIDNWREVGGDDRPIVRLSRETNSGTHVYFLETVLRLGDSKSTLLFDPRTLLLPSSEGITTEVRDNPNAIGYDGLGYVTHEVKVLRIASDPAGPYVLPSAQSVNEGTYPISRDLYMYSNGAPQGLLKTYVDWILSPTAQDIVLDLGFVPVLD